MRGIRVAAPLPSLQEVDALREVRGRRTPPRHPWLDFDLTCFFRVHPPRRLLRARVEAGRHCTVHSTISTWAGRSGLMLLNHPEAFAALTCVCKYLTTCMHRPPSLRAQTHIWPARVLVWTPRGQRGEMLLSKKTRRPSTCHPLRRPSHLLMRRLSRPHTQIHTTSIYI